MTVGVFQFQMSTGIWMHGHKSIYFVERSDYTLLTNSSEHELAPPLLKYDERCEYNNNWAQMRCEQQNLEQNFSNC